jgi:ketosteroid isomerase-like protein
MKPCRGLKNLPVAADKVLMKLSCLIVLALTVIGALTSPTAAQDQTETVKSKIIALEKAWNQAYRYRDKSALADILDDSIILVEEDGSIQSRSVFLASIDAARSTDEQISEPESISVRIFGETAIATGVFLRRGFANGKPHLKRNRFVDTWLKRGASWVCIAASATPVPQ